MARVFRDRRRLAIFVLGALCAMVPARAGLGRTRGRSAAGGVKTAGRLQGKVAIFPLKWDDDRTIYVQLERILRAKGLEVVNGVRPVDTAEQYRELATAMGLAAFVGGAYWEKEDKARVTIQIRSGYSGRKVAEGTFKETPLHMHNEVEEKLWGKVGSALVRACVDANRPRKKGRNPLMIEAGTPLEASAPPTTQARPAPAAQARSASARPAQARVTPPVKVAIQPEL